MVKKDKLQDYFKLSKDEKGKLTLFWLISLIKDRQLTIEDVVDILNSLEPTFSNVDKFNTLLVSEFFSASTISRLYGFGYSKSMNIINTLLSKNIIIKYENKYKILDKEKFKDVGNKLLKGDNYETNNK